MAETLLAHYRLPESLLARVEAPPASGDVGFFRFGHEAICYGQCTAGVSKNVEDSARYDALRNVHIQDSTIQLPFDPARTIENLRRELYVDSLLPARERIVTLEWMLKTYYSLRNILPVVFRRYMQRVYFSDWKQRVFPAWPVDVSVDALHEKILALSMKAVGAKKVPFIWFWPGASPNCLIMTHDVETSAGRDFTSDLIDIDDSFRFKSSFQVIPEGRYEVPPDYIEEIRNRGCEFNIHDLNHDGHLYRERQEFLRRAERINAYGRRYNARGFRAGAMYRMIDWYGAYDFSYDMSFCNVAHLEPKRGGCCTVFPFFIGNILEIPLTTCQDYSIFHILRHRSIDLWKQQINIIRAKNGLMSFLAHPDYLIHRGARRLYQSLLGYLREIVDADKTWVALPGELDLWWRARSQMRLVTKGGDWIIEGPESKRASIAFAVLDGDDCLSYEVLCAQRCPALVEARPYADGGS